VSAAHKGNAYFPEKIKETEMTPADLNEQREGPLFQLSQQPEFFLFGALSIGNIARSLT